MHLPFKMQETKTLQIKKFPIHKIKSSCTWIVIGPPGSGKTTFITDLCYKNRTRFSVIKVWCGTEDTQGSYGKFVKPLFITNEYKQDEHERCVIRQKKCKQEGVMANAIYIMDDCNQDRSIFRTNIMRSQFKNGTQWWDNMFIIGSHYVFDMPPDIRKCVSYVAIFQENSVEERRKLYNNFAIGCTFQEFCDLMDQITGNKTCLIFDKFSGSNKLEDSVFWYKADVHGKWEFGCNEYVKWNTSRYNSKYVENFV